MLFKRWNALHPERKEMRPEIFVLLRDEQLATAYGYLLHRMCVGLSGFFLEITDLLMFSAFDVMYHAWDKAQNPVQERRGPTIREYL